jgi:D-serine ammonia-lyase
MLLLRNRKVLYGVPPTRASIVRLLKLHQNLTSAKGYTPKTIFSILIDHPDQLHHLREIDPDALLRVFVKIDTGYGRCGVVVGGEQFTELLDQIRSTGKGDVILRGLYSHMGNSYSGNSPKDALKSLQAEIKGLQMAAEMAAKITSDSVGPWPKRLLLSVGASPTATAAANVWAELKEEESEVLNEVKELVETFRATKESEFQLELHAGVYPLLDMQQVATHARPPTLVARTPNGAPDPGLSTANIALRIIVEVVSLYPERSKPEALISAGSLALGREPCKSYPGWGVVTPWAPRQSPLSTGFPVYDPDDPNPTGWIVGRISQEHGILTWEGPREEMRELKIGQKLAIWPNHACIAGAGFGWYAVVDSVSDDPDLVRDVWVRCRGW